ncbi:MAG: 4-hydroxy-3-methylbut-2-enyl diphosphate reductase [Acidobacteriota bacterium]
MIQDGDLIRKGFGLRKQVAGDLDRDYASELVARARATGGTLTWPSFSIQIAKEFGFCYGVERAVEMAYETRQFYPEKRLFLTGEIIHNPKVNGRLRELGYQFLDGAYGSTSGWNDVTDSDVVLIPAFGVTTPQLERLKQTGCVLVDTTCGSVLNVWKNVERYAREGHTALIHGKWKHEETQATASRALMYEGGKYVIVLDMREAELVADTIEGTLPANEMLEALSAAVSPGFDPQTDLGRVGMANQTTMLSSESMAIAVRIREAMRRRYGTEQLAERFRSFDTICSATQDRQDAVHEMLRTPPDLMVIIGGFNSSNTGHLSEICSAVMPTFHIESADQIHDESRIEHLPVGKKNAVETSGWLPASTRRVGVTAGASTPDREIGRVIARLMQIRNLDM